MAVCIYHSASSDGGFLPHGNWIGDVSNYGYLGVYLFFAISGFIIPYSMWRSGYQLRSFGAFLAKRCVRIEPPYILSLLLVLLWYTFGSYDPFYSGPKVIWDLPRIASHIGYVTPWVGQEWYIHIYWTLAIEFQYYLLVALIFPLLFHQQKWVRMLTYLSLAVPCMLEFHLFHDIRFIACYLPLFMMGIALAQYFAGMLRLWELWALLLVALSQYFFTLDWKDIFAGFLGVLVILTVKKGWKLTNFLGKISYSLYLTHILAWMIFSGYVTWYQPDLLMRYVLLLIALPTFVAFAYGFYHLIEKPSIKWGKKIVYK